MVAWLMPEGAQAHSVNKRILIDHGFLGAARLELN